MEKKIDVIINPNAKKFRTGIDSVSNYTIYNSSNVTVSTPESVKELKEVVKSCKLNHSDYICIGGGDGTIHLVISELITAYSPDSVPPILILKEGTMNNVARSVKLKGSGHKLLKRLLNTIEYVNIVETEERFTLKINDKYCFLFGTGYVVNFLNQVYSGLEKGFFTNILVGIKAAGDLFRNPKDYRIFSLTEQAIFIDGKKILINPVSGILAGTVEHIGMGLSPLREALQSNSTFQIITIGMNPRGILRFLNKLRTGKRIKSPKYSNVFGQSILIKNKGIFEYTMDGDIYTAENTLKVDIGPKITLVKI